MKKIISILCLVAFINLYLPTFAVNVPVNTSIFISPIDTVTSKNTTIERIPCNITDDVIIDNTVVFKAGSRAELQVSEVKKARCWGNAGEISISNGYVYDNKGQRHKVSFTKEYTGEQKDWVVPVAWVGFFFLILPIFFGFVHGGQAKVSSNSEMEVYLTSPFVFNP